MKLFRLLILLFATTTLACAGDAEFKGVVHAIESNYGVHHMHIPLLGVALFFARPEGASGLRVAVFEGFQTSNNVSDVSRVVEHSLGPDWYPFVRVRSNSGGNGSGETTLIYTNPSAGTMRMMIVSLEPSEATVVELKLNERTIRKWLSDPKEEAEGENRHGKNGSSD